jgi:hypothetical protein
MKCCFHAYAALGAGSFLAEIASGLASLGERRL